MCQIIKCALCDGVFHRIDKKKHYDVCKGLASHDRRGPAAPVERRGSRGGSAAAPRSRASDPTEVAEPHPALWPGDYACLRKWPERGGRVLFCGVIKEMWVIGVELPTKRASSMCDGEHEGRRVHQARRRRRPLGPARAARPDISALNRAPVQGTHDEFALAGTTVVAGAPDLASMRASCATAMIRAVVATEIGVHP